MMFSASPMLVLDNEITFVSSTVTSSDIIDTFITDVTVYLKINHTWIGDLTIELTHADSNTSVELYNFFCGCLDNNIDAYLNDKFDDSACISCVQENCALCGNFYPYQSLSKLYGLNPNSDWTLSVTDNFPENDFGILLEWGISIEAQDQTTTSTPFVYDIFSDSPGSVIADGNLQSTTIESSGIVGTSITDVNLYFNISHTWISDIILFLTHEQSGTRVTLKDGGCDGLCERDNVYAAIDDQQWNGDFCRVCEDLDCAACNGPYRSVDPLSNFNGLEPNSIWNLTFSDDFPSGDGGTLDYWRIEIASE